jgi:hypothetical protein
MADGYTLLDVDDVEALHRYTAPRQGIITTDASEAQWLATRSWQRQLMASSTVVALHVIPILARDTETYYLRMHEMPMFNWHMKKTLTWQPKYG